MDYTSSMRGLLAQAKKGQQYKRLPKPARICMFIGLLPLIVECAVLIAIYYCVNFIQKLICAPADFLNGFLKQERDGVKHLSQAIMYAIAFPMVFLFKVMLSFLSVYMYLIWFLIMCLTYLVTLGAIKWQPYLFDVKYEEEEVKYEFTPSADAGKVWSYVQVFLFVLYFVGMILQLIGPIETRLVTSYWDTYYTYSTTHIVVGIVFCAIYTVVTTLVLLIFFRKKKPNENVLPDAIPDSAFSYDLSIEEIEIPQNVKSIGSFAFRGCANLKKIRYEGTVDDWISIQKGPGWNEGVPAKYVFCKDASVAI